MQKKINIVGDWVLGAVFFTFCSLFLGLMWAHLVSDKKISTLFVPIDSSGTWTAIAAIATFITAIVAAYTATKATRIAQNADNLNKKIFTTNYLLNEIRNEQIIDLETNLTSRRNRNKLIYTENNYLDEIIALRSLMTAKAIKNRTEKKDHIEHYIRYFKELNYKIVELEQAHSNFNDPDKGLFAAAFQSVSQILTRIISQAEKIDTTNQNLLWTIDEFLDKVKQVTELDKLDHHMNICITYLDNVMLLDKCIKNFRSILRTDEELIKNGTLDQSIYTVWMAQKLTFIYDIQDHLNSNTKCDINYISKLMNPHCK